MIVTRPSALRQRGDAERRAVGVERDTLVADAQVVIDEARRRPGRCSEHARAAPRRRTRRGLRRARPRSAAREPAMPSSKTEGERRTSTSAKRASNCSLRFVTKRGQCAVPGMMLFRCRKHLAAIADAEREAVGAREEARNSSRTRRVEQDRLRPALARAQHVAVREAAARDERRGSRAGGTGPAIRSVMCTSSAAKPARSNAAAISIWLLTPCSRRIATRGRAPRAMYGAATSSRGSKRSATESPGSSRRALRRVLLVGALRIVAQALHAP